jgi:hypothetical protein
MCRDIEIRDSKLPRRHREIRALDPEIQTLAHERWSATTDEISLP